MAAKHHDKTEAPTQKKKKEARREGRAARSPDLVAWVSLLAITMVLPGLFNRVGAAVREMLSGALAAAARPDPAKVPAAFGGALGSLLSVTAPTLVSLLVLAVVGNLAQVGLIFTGKPLKPTASRLNPLKGLKRMFSIKGLWQAAAASMKLAVIGTVVWMLTSSASSDLLGTPGRSTSAAVAQVAALSLRLIQIIAAVCVVIGLGDYAVKRRDHQRDLRMSKHEVKQEYKDAEGDPHLRARMRSNRLAMSRNRMIGAVATADVVITNPTHFAVAIAYTREQGAPKVVARGADATATRIREEAGRHGVPCVESPPLARTLHRLCRPGEEIPTELFQAVATVLAFLHRLGAARASLGTGSRGVTTGRVIGLDVVDTWTPSSGELTRVTPGVRRRAARAAARATGRAPGPRSGAADHPEVGRTAHSQRNGADRDGVTGSSGEATA